MTTNYQVIVGKRIRRWRQFSGLSSHELAKRVNVAQPTVVSWETGYRNMYMPDLVRVAEALGVPMTVMLMGLHWEGVSQ